MGGRRLERLGADCPCARPIPTSRRRSAWFDGGSFGLIVNVFIVADDGQMYQQTYQDGVGLGCGCHPSAASFAAGPGGNVVGHWPD